MKFRADWALERQLEATERHARHEAVRTAIGAVLHHLRSGTRGHRRGGQALADHLIAARRCAAHENEWHVVRLLQDALDYCEGRTLKPEFEERFRLFQDGARNEVNLHYVQGILSATADYVKRLGDEYLSGHPDATPAELLAELSAVTADGAYAEAPDELPGRYRIVRGRAETALWIQRIFRNRLDIVNAAEAARTIVTSPDALALLADDDQGQLILRAAELKRQAHGLRLVRQVSADPAASEADLHRVLRDNTWIFGGHYLGAAAQRHLTAGSELDIPLLRADGVLHVVELKRSMRVHAIVKRHRNAWVPTAEVHDAVGQAINYLVALDENRHAIREHYGIETRRASALVLIGHPGVHPDIPEEAVNDTLRTFNAHTGRVEVLTYKELLDSAERSLMGSVGRERHITPAQPTPVPRSST
ncbi:Shedu anti-phage system protein SduA domain-containing protein [Amycolatopsis jejuensis]|uniref:Shedu anti-phage system protein SduA domain-containing protein n=1 Tax=Amycolatopsis jejuensis TaxID=330084 RepID=UPI00068C80CC|nr:Shedu anti-phage system protein SduA domain-containing protein [Amycolatopsis jejuensis]